jgi:hypothetical protein
MNQLSRSLSLQPLQSLRRRSRRQRQLRAQVLRMKKKMMLSLILLEALKRK